MILYSSNSRDPSLPPGSIIIILFACFYHSQYPQAAQALYTSLKSKGWQPWEKRRKKHPLIPQVVSA